MIFDPSFVLGGSGPFEELPVQRQLVFREHYIPSFLMRPCSSDSTHAPPSPIVSGMVEWTPCQCGVCLSNLLNFSFFSTSKLILLRQVLGLSCDQICQPGLRGMSVQEKGPCQEGGHVISLRS